MKGTWFMVPATLYCLLGGPCTSAFSQEHSQVHSEVPQLTLRTLRPDAQPAIAPNAEILIFIHGMDSRAEEADDITKTLFGAMVTPPNPPSAATSKSKHRRSESTVAKISELHLGKVRDTAGHGQSRSACE